MNDHNAIEETQSGENSGAAPDAIAGQRETRRLRGKALRKACPRSSHASVILGQSHRDPMGLIEESNHGRVPRLLPIRFTRMAESPLAFFRGTAALQAYDLMGTPSSGVKVQCCGDCHLMNFGGFATPERALVFDINDFDETFPAPFEWDVKRLATSFVLAAQWRGFDDARQAVLGMVEAYRTSQAKFADASVLETWYAKISVAEMVQDAQGDSKILKRLGRGIDKAVQNTSEHIFQKIVKLDAGKPRIVDQPPLLFHAHPSEFDLERDVKPFFESYRRSLPPDRRALLDRFEILDAAYKVVGIGAVGTRCFILLLAGDQDDHLFLQVKEARRSVLEGMAGASPHAHNGERVVTGQRLMQSASDIFLGWSEGHGGDFYVRQLRDIKLAPNLTDYSPRLLEAYGRLCGRTLARAHAKAGDAPTIAGYLGDSDTFDEAIADYAIAYADQVEGDYKTFQAAIRAGRFPIETVPSEMEQAIR